MGKLSQKRNNSLAREKSLAKKNPSYTSTYRGVNNQSSSLTVSSTTHLVDSNDLGLGVDQTKHQNHKKGNYQILDFLIPTEVKEEALLGRVELEESRGVVSKEADSMAKYIMDNTEASPEKIREMVRYFNSHSGDILTDKITNGTITWKLYGGTVGRVWAEKLLRQMSWEDRKADTADDLLSRFHLLKLQDQDYIENRFESVEVKQSIYKNYEALIKNWNAWLTNYYVNLLRNQNKKIVEILRRAKNTTADKNSFLNTGSLYQIDNYIDESTKDWAIDVYDIYV